MSNRTMFAGMLVAALAFAMPLPGAAQDYGSRKQITAQDLEKAKPTATVELEAEQVRLILGGSTGKGVLRYQGKEYPFTFKGGSAGGVGVTKVNATGDVYFLNKVEDFAGTYTAIGAGGAVGAGVGKSQYQNNNNVIISLRSKTEGLALNMGIGVATVSLTK